MLSEAGGKSSANFAAYDQIDKAPEEKERITISTAHVEYETEKDTMLTLIVQVTPIMQNMISGAAQMGGAILVVNAADAQCHKPENTLARRLSSI